MMTQSLQGLLLFRSSALSLYLPALARGVQRAAGVAALWPRRGPISISMHTRALIQPIATKPLLQRVCGCGGGGWMFAGSSRRGFTTAMGTAFAPMVDEHDEILNALGALQSVIQAAISNAPDPAGGQAPLVSAELKNDLLALSAFTKRVLENHQDLEEKVLFDRFVKIGLPKSAEPLVMLRREHQSMETYMNELNRLVEQAASPAPAKNTHLLLQQVLQDLVSLVKAHVVKEDYLFYPMVHNYVLLMRNSKELQAQIAQDLAAAMGQKNPEVKEMKTAGQRLVTKYGVVATATD